MVRDNFARFDETRATRVRGDTCPGVAWAGWGSWTRRYRDHCPPSTGSDSPSEKSNVMSQQNLQNFLVYVRDK